MPKQADHPKNMRRHLGLTPSRAILVYLIALLLIGVNEIHSLANWVESAALKWDHAPQVIEYTDQVKKTADQWLIGRAESFEESLFSFAEDLPRLGGDRPPPPAESVVEKGLVALASYTGAAPKLSLGKIRIARPAPEDVSPSPKPTPKPPPEPEAQTDPPARLRPKKVLIAGDSMILEGFGVALERALEKRPGLSVVRKGAYSSGLSRPDYFDWMAHLKELLAEHQPDVLVVSLGANDPQDILDEKRKRHFVASDSWNEIYGRRVDRFLDIAAEQGVAAFWVGLPIMGPDTYNQRIANLNRIAEQRCTAREGCVFVDAWSVLADEKGRYTTFLKADNGRHIRVRAKDKIHLTEAGGRIMVDHFLKIASEHMVLPSDEPRPAEKEGARSAAAPKAPPEDQAQEAQPGLEAAVAPKKPAPAKTTSKPVEAPVNPRPTEKAASAERVEGTVTSRALGREARYTAFVPRTGDPREKFPVLYLLNGPVNGDDATEKAAELLLELAARHGMIVVSPETNGLSWYADSPFAEEIQMETFIIDELIPAVEAELPAAPGRRGAAGMVMGGHGAMVLSMRRPGVFRSASSISGVLDITRHPDQWGLKRVFGPFDKENFITWGAHSAFFLSIKHRQKIKDMDLFVSAAEDDPHTRDENLAFHRKLVKMGVDHQWRLAPGPADWGFFRGQLAEHLAFHARALTDGDKKENDG